MSANNMRAQTAPPPTAFASTISNAVEALQNGDIDRVVRIIEGMAPAAARDPFATRAAALIYSSAGRYENAIVWFDRALAANGPQPALLAAKGVAELGAARHADAVTTFNRALIDRPNDPETWYNRGVALDALGDLDDALSSFATALDQRPAYFDATRRHCATLAKLGRLSEALSAANSLVEHQGQAIADCWCLRGNIQNGVGLFADALDSYARALSLRPDDLPALINRAGMLNEVGLYSEALADADRVLAASASHPQALLARANALHKLDRQAEADQTYRAAFSVEPMTTHPATRQSPEFRALFLFAPTAGNTPIDDLITFSTFESRVLMLLPGIDYDIEKLKACADVVINLVSDADRSEAALAQVAEVAAALGKPFVNPPEKILGTDRATSAAALHGIPGCRVPRTHRMSRAAMQALALAPSPEIYVPMIARVAGLHGGDAMELCNTLDDVARFVDAERKASDFYLSEYVDYRSPDGLFRKYRFVFVGEEILPYHLAIGDQWKVHHATTRMADEKWMQEEEARFLIHPETDFGPEAYRALGAIRDRLGLDYFGIDCGLDQSGHVVVFEANASMRVHLRNSAFPYKNDAVMKIKTAFANMLRTKAATA